MKKLNITHALLFCAIYAFSVGEVLADGTDGPPVRPKSFQALISGTLEAKQQANLLNSLVTNINNDANYYEESDFTVTTSSDGERTLTESEKQKLTFGFPTSADGIEPGLRTNGDSYIQRKCCPIGIPIATITGQNCRPTYKCVQKVINSKDFKSVIGCDRGLWGIGKSKACSKYLEHANKFIKEASGLADTFRRQSAKKIEERNNIRTRIQEFVEAQDDPLSTAGMAGQIALLKTTPGSTSRAKKTWDDIAGSTIDGSADTAKIGEAIKNTLGNSIFGKYLEKKINEALGTDETEEAISKILAVCSRLQNDTNCPLRDSVLSGERAQQTPSLSEGDDNTTGEPSDASVQH
jgi:hypothetical protein